ncbi:MAG: recombinase family protein [Candidatus Saccharimonadales bacterium]
MIKALAISRVSTKNQAENNHSLDAQRSNVDKMALELNCQIVNRWEMAVSSRKGTNLKRKDLNEARNMCRHDKNIKYILLDRVNRLGREARYLTYYMLQLEIDYGVQLIFCDTSQQELNGTDAKTFLKRVEKLVDAENENDERADVSSARMKARVEMGYYPFYPHQGYKKTEAADGLHIPDEPRYSLLKEALQATASFAMTPREAVAWLRTKEYRTPPIYRKGKDNIKQKKGERHLDLSHFYDIMKSPYYAGILQVKNWPINEKGLHQRMITPEEYEVNFALATGRKVRKKMKFNPDFRLNLSVHQTCGHPNAKLTGINHSNGKGWWRKEYLCRECKKRIPQQKVHDSMQRILASVRDTKNGSKALRIALEAVWQKNQAYRIERAKTIAQDIQQLESSRSELIMTLAANKDLADDIRAEISKNKEKIAGLEAELSRVNDVDEDFREFMDYALGYVENLRVKFWTLPGESVTKCKQLLFFNEIYVAQDGRVYTPQISPIYTLLNANDGSKAVKNAHMVELAGTAPASVGRMVRILQA